MLYAALKGRSSTNARSAALRDGLRRKEEADFSVSFPAVETAGNYQSSPGGDCAFRSATLRGPAAQGRGFLGSPFHGHKWPFFRQSRSAALRAGLRREEESFLDPLRGPEGPLFHLRSACRLRDGLRRKNKPLAHSYQPLARTKTRKTGQNCGPAGA
jgi:hypothetical protein